MPATKPATVKLFSFAPLSFGSTTLSEKSKRLIVSFPLTYVVFTGDYGFSEQRFISVQCDKPFTIMNVEKVFNSVDEVAAFLLYERDNLLQHFIKITKDNIRKSGVR